MREYRYITPLQIGREYQGPPGFPPRRAVYTSLPQRILLFVTQLALPTLRKLLDPTVVHNRDCQNSLAAHACQTCDCSIFCGTGCRRQQNTTSNRRVYCVAIRTEIHDN